MNSKVSKRLMFSGMAIWGRIPVTALPAYIMGQFLGAGAVAGLLVAVWWDVMKV